MTPFFSIIVPCRDVEKNVRKCFDSLVSQSFMDWEAIVGVETPKDGTEAIVREYAAVDSRFRVFSAPRSGSCSATLNVGIDMAAGEHIIFRGKDQKCICGLRGQDREFTPRALFAAELFFRCCFMTSKAHRASRHSGVPTK